MKKWTKQLCFYMMGFITAAAFFLSADTSWASSVLKAIYVDDTPINLYVDGYYKTIPESSKPFNYNGETFIGLKYIAEALGKQVNWDEGSRTATITNPLPVTNTYSESFTDSTRASDYWIKKSGEKWKFDGANGLLINSDGHMDLTGILPDYPCNYTVEFEAAIVDKNLLLGVYLGKNNSGDLGDTFAVTDNQSYAGSVYYGTSFFEYEIASVDTKRIRKLIADVPQGSYELNKYYPIKIQVKNKYADLYINGQYIISHALAMEKPAFGFIGNHYGTTEYPYYVRNFKIALN